MIDWRLEYEYCSDPPNAVRQILTHPSGKNEVIELSLFNDHRYAFYYWTKWSKNNKQKCDLITFDWHQDLGYPHEEKQSELEKLDLNNLSEVSFFAWARLNPNNDTHILAAAYLNQINDIWVVCKQGMDWEWDDEYIEDAWGNKHTIRKFKTPNKLRDSLFQSQVTGVYLDIDLDYFTIENESSIEGHYCTYESDNFISNLIDYKSELMNWILKRVEGITIALEPEFTGGISKSLELLTNIERLWFKNSIGTMNVEWKHLNK